MVSTSVKRTKSLLIDEYITRLETGNALLDDSPQNLVEVVGILKSYGVVLDAYSVNLCYSPKLPQTTIVSHLTHLFWEKVFKCFM